MIKKTSGSITTFLFFLLLAVLLILYARGYNNSIGWEVVTTADVISSPEIKVDGNLVNAVISSEKYLLSESYTGTRINRNYLMDGIFLLIGWTGVLLALTAGSFLKRPGFLIVLALFTLLLNRLNLPQVGLFEQFSSAALIIPFLAFVGPLLYFHEFRPETSFLVRFLSLVALTTAICFFGISNYPIFVDHFAAHSLFSFSIAGLLFLFVIAEENVFAILQIVTLNKGSKGNHKHFILLSSIYLVNLILYYLNKSGIVPNSFSFFDPFLLLAISSIVTLWTLRHKAQFASKYFESNLFFTLVFAGGTILMSVLCLAFFRGLDAVYESFHYFILYFHIGFGFFFFLYIIINFIDPLAEGLEVFKIAYKEQHFPYVSARLGGFAAILGFYFLATQEPYDLLKSGYYSSLGLIEETGGKRGLAEQYYEQAGFLGYNTHHPNYKLAWINSDKGNKYLTKIHFEKAATRFPSPFATINYANLDLETNLPKVQSTLLRANDRFNSGEITNNLGVLRLKNQEYSLALQDFESAEASNSWNQAPLLNKWYSYRKLRSSLTSLAEEEFENGNYGVKSNILLSNWYTSPFLDERFKDAPPLHRQAYLLNALAEFDQDTLTKLALHEIEVSTNGNFNDRLRKTLAVHYYQKGQVNKALQMLDYLQTNSYTNEKGAYFKDMGVLALDQGAYRLALDFFDQAERFGFGEVGVLRLEAFSILDKELAIKEIAELRTSASIDTSFTSTALRLIQGNELNVKNANANPADINLLTDEELIKEASKNAFNETFVVSAVSLLNERGKTEGYDIVLEAIEVNPYAVNLLKLYALTALDQNLTAYAESVLPRIGALASREDFNSFLAVFNEKKEAQNNSDW